MCGSNGYKRALHTDGTNYYLGYGFPDIGGSALIYGTDLRFYYGASRTLGMYLSSVGEFHSSVASSFGSTIDVSGALTLSDKICTASYVSEVTGWQITNAGAVS